MNLQMVKGIALVGAILLAIATLASFGALSVQNTVSYYFILIVMVCGLGIYTGNSGVLSFGHMSFVAIGAYLTALLTLSPAIKGAILPNLPIFLKQIHLDFWISLPLSLVIVGLVGLLVGSFISRLAGAAAAIATLGLLIIVNSVLIGASDFTRGSQAIYGIPKTIGIWVAVAFAILTYAVARVFKISRPGLLVRVTREDEPAAASIGISINRMRLISWTLSAIIMGLGGILFAHQIAVFSPKEFYFHQTFTILVMLIVGGMISVSGAVAGTTLIVVLIEILRRIEEGGILFGIPIPQMFGLTDIGLSLAVLFALYRQSTGLMGRFEAEDLLIGLKRRINRSLPQTNVEDTKESIAADKATATNHAPEIIADYLQTFHDQKMTIRASGLSKHYGGIIALDGVNISLAAGEILGLIGPNGSGKSTLLSCISGLQEPTKGEIHIKDVETTNWTPQLYAHHGVGRTFQNIRLFRQLTVAENVKAALLSVQKHKPSLSVDDLTRHLLGDARLLHLENRVADTLSYGDQRRLEIVRALALAPQFLLLDEPAAGMNERESRELMDFLSGLRRDHGIGILIIDHDLHMILRFCDRIIVLNKGEVIAEGNASEIREHPEVISAYIG